MQNKTFEEKNIKSANGILMLILLILATIFSMAAIPIGSAMLGYSIAAGGFVLAVGIIGIIAFPIMFAGLRIVRPNEAKIFTLFGKYYGTIKKEGFYYVHPFSTCFSPAYNTAKQEAHAKQQKALEEGKSVFIPVNNLSKAVSLKTQTLDNCKQKVNDVLGNPIIVGAIVIWHVENPTQAVFAVENYNEYLSIQTDSTIRNTARLYPYDIFDDDEDNDDLKEKTLRSSSLEIAETMKEELQKRVANAGLVIEEVRITHLAYAEEIAAAMLQRQQAAAIIAARQKIVDGAVGMVKMAIDKLGEDEIVVLDEERKAAMVSNLLVVLCGNKDAQPIVNSGSLY